MPLEVADEWIEFLQQRIGPGHPLYGKNVFPSCRKEDTQDTIIQFDIDDDETYAIVNFDKTYTVKGKQMPEVEVLKTREELKERFHDDHLNSVAQ